MTDVNRAKVRELPLLPRALPESKLDIYTWDGRINPDKAFALVMKTMKELTPEQFRETCHQAIPDDGR